MIWKLEAFIQIGPVIFHKKFLTTHVAFNSLDETKYFTSIYNFLPIFGGAILKNTLWGT